VNFYSASAVTQGRRIGSNSTDDHRFDSRLGERTLHSNTIICGFFALLKLVFERCVSAIFGRNGDS
jgi:hypothetical protein